MCSHLWRQPARRATLLLAALALAGCASVDMERAVAITNHEAAAFTEGRLRLAQSDAERAEGAREAARLLAAPLGQPQAVQLALAQSPALQALLAQSGADAAAAAQAGRIANPLFSFERTRLGGELEIARLLSFGLLDVLTLPHRAGIARQRIAQGQSRLTADVVSHVTQVRQAWVRAVAAQQSLGYARLVAEGADAGADLARRMESAGNWNKLARARQQLFHADAAAQMTDAEQAASAAREQLVRALGLDDAQAAQLKLPDRLPDLPTQPLAREDVARTAREARLDVRLARAALDASSAAQGLGALTSFIDVEAGVRRDSVWASDASSSGTRRGWELGLRLPLFDAGDARRAGLNAQTLAAAHRLEVTLRAAGSQLRESYAAYRSAYTLARHYQNEVVPLRQLIADENLLRYNGMLIGVFELLADAREQVASVVAAIGAQQQFWLADAALQASLIGQPTAASVGITPVTGGGRDAQAH